MLVNSCRPSGTWARPRSTMREGARPVMGSPSNLTEPSRIGSRLETARSAVVLPAPLAPTSETIWPWPTRRLTSCSTRASPYATERFCTSSKRVGLAQVRLDHARVVDEALRGALGDDLAVVQHHDPRGEAHHGFQHVLDDQHAHAAGG